MNDQDEFYNVSPEADPIRQGDIFYPVPYVTPIDLNSATYGYSEEVTAASSPWDAMKDKESLTVTLAVQPSWAIVVSQDCDVRNPSISLCPIEPLTNLGNNLPALDKKEKWATYITRDLRNMPGVFYLPESEKIGLTEKNYVNFGKVFQLDSTSLDGKKSNLRKGRLNDDADEHFREKLANYFRRYAYEEHYPLNKEELEAYEKKRGAVVSKRFSWQKQTSPKVENVKKS